MVKEYGAQRSHVVNCWDRANTDDKKSPFFLFIYADDEVAVARGRGGGLAFWAATARCLGSFCWYRFLRLSVSHAIRGQLMPCMCVGYDHEVYLEVS